jgi:regulator of replication initiation timing
MTKTDTEAIRGALDALNRVFVTNSRDWGANRTEAWLWGVVVGWDNDGGNEALEHLATKFGWNRAAVAQLRTERAGFAQIEQLLTEVSELRTENAKLREHEERTEKVMDIVERSLNQVSAKRAEAETERDALKSQRKAVLDLCEDAVQYGWHDHVGELATDSTCTDRCRNRSAWDLDPAAVRSAYGINDSPEGEER